MGSPDGTAGGDRRGRDGCEGPGDRNGLGGRHGVGSHDDRCWRTARCVTTGCKTLRGSVRSAKAPCCVARASVMSGSVCAQIMKGHAKAAERFHVEPLGDARSARARDALASRTYIASDARETLHRVPFPACHTTLKSCVFGAFPLPAFLWQGRPEGSPLGGQGKAGAAPHRGNASKPTRKQGKAKTKANQRKAKNKNPDQRRAKHDHSPTRNTRVTGRASDVAPILTSSPVTERGKGALPS